MIAKKLELEGGHGTLLATLVIAESREQNRRSGSEK
jgi:hypothetical protein